MFEPIGRGQGREPFTKEQIDKFEQKVIGDPKATYSFNGLVDFDWIVGEDGYFFFTRPFIVKCFEASVSVRQTCNS